MKNRGDYTEDGTTLFTHAYNLPEQFGERPPVDIDPKTVKAVRDFLSLIAPHYDVAGAILYGGRVRRSHRVDSDADVAVLLKGSRENAYRVAWDEARQAAAMLVEDGIDISPHPVWMDEWQHPDTPLNPALLRSIAQEGVRL